MYYARLEGKHTVNTARLLVPDDTRGPVVLDATASSNPLYEVFDKAVLRLAPKGARSYGNVTLHISRGHRTGKRYMTLNAKQVCAELIFDLCKRIPPDSMVFVVCHKDVEAVLAAHSPPFEMLTGHWGAIAGSNEWRDCDTVVIFGLPYRRDTWAPNVFMACQGPQSTGWLNSPGNRPFNNHSDIRVALRNGQMITDVVQAINRVRSRQVIDAKGNCPETDIYILLPNDSTYRLHEALLEGIKKEMPGIKVVEWDYAGQKQKKAGRPRKSNYEAGLIKFLENMNDGRVPPAQIRKLLSMSPRTMERLIANASDPTLELGQAVQKAGVRYEVIRRGKTRKAFFIKDSAGIL
jgi:hypothetical protein